MISQDNCITVESLVKLFPTIEDINYKKIIIVFDTDYTDDELDKIYDLLKNKWNVNKLHRLDVTGSLWGTECAYENHHRLIEEKIIFIANCDLDIIDKAYDLYEYLKEGYQTYFVLAAWVMGIDVYNAILSHERKNNE